MNKTDQVEALTKTLQLLLAQAGRPASRGGGPDMKSFVKQTIRERHPELRCSGSSPRA